MLKKLIIGAIALVIAGTTLVVAQPFGGRSGGPFGRTPPTAEERAIMADAFIGGLKGVLKLTPAQERNWPPVEAAIRDVIRERAERMATMQSQPPTDALQRLRRHSEMLTGMAAGLKKVLDAAEPLYQTLDDSQKQRITSVGKMVAMHHMARMGNRGPGRGFGPFGGHGPGSEH
jgi:zinc resistance-associated protein